MVMKHGCMVTTLRLSSSRRSGSRQIHRGRKSASSSQECQVHVDRFFPHPRNCPQGIRTTWSNRQWQVLLRGYEAADGGHSVQTPTQVKKKIGFSTMTKRPLTHHSLFDNS